MNEINYDIPAINIVVVLIQNNPITTPLPTYDSC